MIIYVPYDRNDQKYEAGVAFTVTTVLDRFIEEGVRRVYGFFLSALFPPFKVFRMCYLACIFCLSLLHLSFPPRKGARYTLVSCGISIINFRFILEAFRPEKPLLTPSCVL